MRSSRLTTQRPNAVSVMEKNWWDESIMALTVVCIYGREWWDCIRFNEVFLMKLRELNSNVPFSVSSISALNLVYQRNGDGEAKSPACRAGVREAVLHTVEQGTRLPSQVGTVLRCDVHVLHASTLRWTIYLWNCSVNQVLWEEFELCSRRTWSKRKTGWSSLRASGRCSL